MILCSLKFKSPTGRYYLNYNNYYWELLGLIPDTASSINGRLEFHNSLSPGKCCKFSSQSVNSEGIGHMVLSPNDDKGKPVDRLEQLRSFAHGYHCACLLVDVSETRTEDTSSRAIITVPAVKQMLAIWFSDQYDGSVEAKVNAGSSTLSIRICVGQPYDDSNGEGVYLCCNNGTLLTKEVDHFRNQFDQKLKIFDRRLHTLRTYSVEDD